MLVSNVSWTEIMSDEVQTKVRAGIKKMVKGKSEAQLSDSVDVLILTTAHDAEDGRLIRHQNSFGRAGISAVIVSLQFKSRLSRFVKGTIRSLRVIKQIKPRCILLPDPELHLFLSPLIYKKYRVIADVHEDYSSVTFDRYWLKGFAAKAVRICLKVLPKVRSSFSHIEIVANPNYGSRGCILVENIPHRDDLPGRSDSSDLRAVYVGDIRESRGIERMLQLTTEIPELHLDLIGPCSFPERLQVRIKELGLRERVIWHGRRSYADSWKLASKSTIGLCLLDDTPAFQEAIPSKIWEYWCLGLPVLVTNLRSMAALVNKVQGGMVLNSEDDTNRIVAWLRDSSMLDEQGKRGFKAFSQSSEQNAYRLVSAYHKALGA